MVPGSLNLIHCEEINDLECKKNIASGSHGSGHVPNLIFSAEAGGTWVSYSGNVFIIPPPGDSENFAIIMQHKNRKESLLQAERVSNMKGSQFFNFGSDKKAVNVAPFEWHTGNLIRVHPITDAKKDFMCKRKSIENLVGKFAYNRRVRAFFWPASRVVSGQVSCPE